MKTLTQQYIAIMGAVEVFRELQKSQGTNLSNTLEGLLDAAETLKRLNDLVEYVTPEE